MYCIYEKNIIERPEEVIEDEVNIWDGDKVKDILRFLNINRKVKISRMQLYRCMKKKMPIAEKYLVFEIKM